MATQCHALKAAVDYPGAGGICAEAKVWDCDGGRPRARRISPLSKRSKTPKATLKWADSVGSRRCLFGRRSGATLKPLLDLDIDPTNGSSRQTSAQREGSCSFQPIKGRAAEPRKPNEFMPPNEPHTMPRRIGSVAVERSRTSVPESTEPALVRHSHLKCTHILGPTIHKATSAKCRPGR